jgi:transcriptional regulator with XRE-family HTH domain
MKNAEFGAYLKAQREEKGIPQRIVAHALNVDTSTLSKMELGDRQITISMIKSLADILEIDFKGLQIMYISEKVMDDFEGQPYLKEALNHLSKKLSK